MVPMMSGSKRDTTFYIVAYDISNDRRRTKIHKTLSGFGQWTQFSLFECHLSDKQYLQLRQRLDQHLKPDEDSVRFYSLCAGCLNKVETVGGEKPADPGVLIV
jgi:CRISPR-associated protein Cas2